MRFFTVSYAVVFGITTGFSVAQSKVLETLTHRCPSSVRIEPTLIYVIGDGMVKGSQSPIRLHRKDKNTATPFTPSSTVALIPSGNLTWFCGPTADQKGGTVANSRCPEGTNALRAKLDRDRYLKIQCLND